MCRPGQKELLLAFARLLFCKTALAGASAVVAESVRFELTVGRPITSFQDWLLKPLGQLSIEEIIPFDP